MKLNTKILKINKQNPETRKINICAKKIQEKEVVSFPTETVYGLGADVFSKKAISKIFKAKNRPADNPLIAHISKKEDIFLLAKEVPDYVFPLIDKFWPGPLTIVLKKKKTVPLIATGGLDTIGIRMPSNKIALKLIEKSKTPIVAPSANISGKPSPTSFLHVYEDFNGKIPIIIDGGKCKIGIESTVLDLSTDKPKILRPGYVTESDLKDFFKKIEIHKSSNKSIKNVKSPGMKYTHYSPKAEVILIENKKDKDVSRKIKSLINKNKSKKIGLVTFNNYNLKKQTNIFTKEYNKDINKYAKDLFYNFRDFDNKKIDIIIIEGIKEIDLGRAILNRVRKAANKIIK